MESRNLIAIGTILMFLVVAWSFATTAMDYFNFKQESAPADIRITTLEGCEECGSMEAVVSGVKSKNVDVGDEDVLDYEAPEQASLIEEYGIGKLPAVVVEGDVEKLSLSGFEKKNGALVYETGQAPYVETSSGRVRGEVVLVQIVDSSCEKCRDLDQVKPYLEGEGVYVSSYSVIEEGDAGDLISNFSIETLPAAIMSGDLVVYPAVVEALAPIADVFDSAMVISSVPPYKEIGTGDVRGLAEVVYLDDESCEDCYDVQLHRTAIQNIGVFIDSEETVDVNSTEGQSLVEEYNITAVPTVLLSGDLEIYTGLDSIWADVGTVEDGTYVFRNMEAIGNVQYREI